MSDLASRWAELERWLDRALDVEPERRAEWIAAQPLPPELRDALTQAVARAEVPGEFDRLRRDLASGSVTEADWIGRRVGAFRIERLLGEGGSASVYLAAREQAGFDQRVALKLLRQGLFRADDRALFERERRILAALEHPHIARLIDGGVTDNGVPYIAMEYVDGEPITAHCDRLFMPLSRRIALFVEVCDVVAYAQRNLVVHRDLKPSNILVARDGTLKLLDFGIARLLADDGSDARTVTAALRLTPGYAAPEQFERGGAITTATDVYALGVLLHELLAGERPRFEAHGAVPPPSACLSGADAAARAQARASTPVALARALRGDLDTLVRTSLAPEPSRRYADAAAFGADLKRWLDGLPIAARPASFAYRARKFVARHRFNVLAAAAAVLALAIGMLVSLHQAGVAQRAARLAQGETARANAIKDFLFDLFSKSNPVTKAPIKDVDALLARGGELAEERFGATPLGADVLGVLGHTLAEREQFDAARPLLQRSLALLRLSEGDQGEHTIQVQVQLAKLAYVSGHYAEGVAALRPAIDAYRKGPQTVPESAARALHLLAVLYSRAGEIDAGVVAEEQALALLRDSRDEDLREEVTGSLGGTYSQVGRYEEALAIQQQVLRNSEKRYAPGDINLAVDLNNVSGVLVNLARFPQAEAMQRRAIAVMHKGRPDGSQWEAVYHNGLARILGYQERFDEARSEQDAAVAMAAKAIGENHPEALIAQANRDWLLVQSGDPGAAREAMTQALERLRTALGDQPAVARVERYLGQSLLWSGEWVEAQLAFERALRIDAAKRGGKTQDAGLDRMGLAQVALARGDAVAALELAQAGIASISPPLPAIHPLALDAALTLAEAQAAKRDVAARARFESALADAGNADPPQRTMQARALLGLADLAAVAGDDAGAKARRAEARAVLDGAPSPHSAAAQRLRKRLND